MGGGCMLEIEWSFELAGIFWIGLALGESLGNICVCHRSEMKELDVASCQIQQWYPRFRRVTFRTLIHVLPEAFVDYLLQDGVFLSRSSEAMPARTVVTCPQLQSEDYEHWGEEDDDEGEPEVPAFPELEEAVKASIEKLGGAVFPKLNWSAPKDSAWISTTGNLQCKNFGEVSLLLNASDSVAHDLCHAFDCCDDKTRERPEEIVLALRKWHDLRPELEFRAFVFERVLVGICQREVTGFYPSLKCDADEFEFAIADFFHETIRPQFEADSYTFDCYVTKDRTVKLVDFNPWAGSTLPLLFSWEELEDNYARVSAEIARVSSRIRKAATDAAGIEEGLEAVTLSCCESPEITGASTTTSYGDLGNGVGNAGNSVNTRNGSECEGAHDEYRVEMRIVVSEGLVQPGIRLGTGIPIDFVDRGNWEEVIRREAAQETHREQAGAGA